MKNYLFLVMLVLFASCKAQKESTSLSKLEKTKQFILKTQFEEGNCTLNVLPNKFLELKTDKFGNNYGKLIDSTEVVTLKYSYKKKTLPNTADSNYTENVYISVPSNTKELEISNNELQKVNLVFERQCFCKGTAGFFKVNQGNLKLNIQKNELTLNTDFSVKNIPQKITKINEKINLED